MTIIRTLYDFVISIQIIFMIVLIFYMVENNMDVSIPFRIYIPIGKWLDIDYTFEIHFNYGVLIGILIALMTIYVLTSITVVGTGVTDTGTISIKQFASFFAKYLLLHIPTAFIISRSTIINQYYFLITMLILIIYVLNYITDSGAEK